MKLFNSLLEELHSVPTGVRAPYHFYFSGYQKDFAAPPAELRANGVYAVFSETVPVILKNELIAGNKKALYTDADEETLAFEKGIVARIGEREFVSNKDHYTPYYDRILEVGVTGLIKDIDESLVKFSNDEKKSATLKSMRHTLVGFINMIENHIAEAEKLIDNKEYSNERLNFIIDNCRALTKGKPETFAQALQLVWFCHNAFYYEGRYAMALGRIDQYLYPFYKKDIENSVITDEEVIELLQNIFAKVEKETVNICVAGQSQDGTTDVNGLSYCVLRAVKRCNIPGPNLSARIAANTPDEFLMECLETIGTGLGYPALMNDDVNIAALKKIGYEDKDVYNYSMVGCIENFISGMQPPWSDGRFDTPRFLEYVFNRGKSTISPLRGIDTGDIEEIKSMEDFMKAFEAQLEQGAKYYMAEFNRRNNYINQEYLPDPFLSCLCYDCIGRGLDINNGGSKYPSVHGVGIMGIGTTADSLAAVEKVIFVDKDATLSELRDAINNNFEGYEELHKKLIDAPKYGNNCDDVDKYAVWFVDFLHSVFDKYKTRDGGSIYLGVAANVQNISAGATISATPDGRKKGEPLSDAASPTYGKDTRGPTATINSVAKPDYTKVACGSVVNQKYSPSTFNESNIKKLLALVKTYFKKGGQELQINATSRATLIDAMDHPENYASLVVRVSGFSDYYVRLTKDIQIDILNRTQHE